MKKKVISYFNKELNFYESFKVVADQDDLSIIGSCKRFLQMATLNDAMPCMGRLIRIIGVFDDEDIKCPLVSYEEPILVVDCDEILKVRFPKVYEERESSKQA